MFNRSQLILHISRQLHCRELYQILLRSVEYILSDSTANFGLILNLIEISLVGRASGHESMLSIATYMSANLLIHSFQKNYFKNAII